MSETETYGEPTKGHIVHQGWLRPRLPDSESEIEGEERIELEMGVFHPGSSFQVSVMLDEEDADELREAAKTGAHALFYLSLDDE